MLIWKLIHVIAMFGVVTLWVGAWVIWDLVARTGDRTALRRVDHVSQTTGQIGFVLFLVGIGAGFATALVGSINLTAPWLLIAYALILSDFLVLRWAHLHVVKVRAAQNDDHADLQGVAKSPRANLTLVVVVGFWLLIIVTMIAKPFS